MELATDCGHPDSAVAKNCFVALPANANSTASALATPKCIDPLVEPKSLLACERLIVEAPITPAQRRFPVADLDELFAEYDGSYSPAEDGFAASFGTEEMCL